MSPSEPSEEAAMQREFQSIRDRQEDEEHVDEVSFLRMENAELRLVVAQLRSYVGSLQKDKDKDKDKSRGSSRSSSVCSPTSLGPAAAAGTAEGAAAAAASAEDSLSAHSLRKDLLRMFSNRKRTKFD
jgi:hypothetical protein